MVETFLQHWPANVPLLLYAEGFAAKADGSRLVVRDLAVSSPELMAFKARHRRHRIAHGKGVRMLLRPQLMRKGPDGRLHFQFQRRMHGYRWDAVRFAHKSFALFHAARHTQADVLIWVDADTRFFADVTPRLLEEFVPPDRLVGYLRRNMHSECGFVAYNLRHPATLPLLAQFEAMYTQDLFLAEREFHDSYLFDVVRRRMEERGHQAHDIAAGIGLRAEHVLINSRLGAFMDHLKGPGKRTGSSSPDELIAPRDEAYWKRRG